MTSFNKLSLLSSLFSLSLAFTSCHNGDKEHKASVETVSQTESEAKPVSESPDTTKSFDISSVPISEHELGTFPFFSLPKGLVEQNKPVQRKFDNLFFPINGVMQPIEGKVWKANLVTESGDSESWSLPYFEKSYDEAIKAVGGMKIYEGKVSREELDRIKDKATYFGEDGSLDYWNDPAKVYLIRRADGGEVYIQFSGNSAGAKIQILQKEAFKQTITMLKAEEIEKDLTEKGKAVLYINFDTDKATLKPDGKDAVKEIVKVLNEDKNLKLSIEGHTDNTGNADHNKRLSEDRAQTVLKELIAMGIDESRLKAAGYGAEKPLAANDSEVNKAKNRRVELVKVN